MASIRWFTIASIASALVLATLADAATLTVTSPSDSGGTCPGAACTLRQALATAAAGDRIVFAAGITTITLTTAELSVDKSLTIAGPGAKLLRLQRSSAPGTPDFRIFNTNAGSAIISGLTISNGNVGGAAIFNSGSLLINECTISDNHAPIGAGAIMNDSVLYIIGSAIFSNSGVFGGGLYNSGSLSDSTITNTTISGNVATGPGGDWGGGIYNGSDGILTITSSTIAGNSAFAGGGIYNPNSDSVRVKNTIIAGNTADTLGPDAYGTLISDGFNLIQNPSDVTIGVGGGGTLTGNQTNIDPVLGPLQDNGGQTFTRALLSGSPAIEAGNAGTLHTDQRGMARPVDSPVIPNATGGDGSDIGAYEVQVDQLPGCSTINRMVNNNNDAGTDSLRDVMSKACSGSTITFAPNVTGSIDLTSELPLNKDLSIVGPGANLLSVRRAAVAGNSRVFNVSPASVYAAISGLTIANGLSATSGGGIVNLATLTLTGVTVSGNKALNGGGIFNNFGTLTINNSTLSGNTVSGALGGSGGGLFNSGGHVYFNFSTVSGNTAQGPGGNTDSGGGIITNVGTIDIESSTITGNVGDLGGGIRNINGGGVNARNSIIALNTSGSGPDVNGPLTSGGFNLVGDPAGMSISPAQLTDLIGVTSAQLALGVLQSNGGPTQTHALLPGSIAIDRGNSDGATRDQRGLPRPVDLAAVANAVGGDGSDIGAYEYGASAPPIFMAAMSRKLHGGSGTFDLLLGGVSTNPTIEPRQGPAHTIVATFDKPINAATVTVVEGTATAGAPTFSGNDVVVSLTGVNNQQYVTISLGNVASTDGGSGGNGSVRVGYLAGDVNQNRVVTLADLGLVNAVLAQPVTAANFLKDINASGTLSVADKGIANLNLTKGLPPP